MNWLLGVEVAAYAIWILSMVYHRRDVSDERGRMVVLKSNNFAYWILLLGISAVVIFNRFIHPLSSTQLIGADAVLILGGLVSSAMSMFIFNKTQ